MYLTGTDEHGKKFKKSRRKRVNPQQYVDKIVSGIKDFGRSWIFPMMILFVQLKNVIQK